MDGRAEKSAARVGSWSGQWFLLYFIYIHSPVIVKCGLEHKLVTTMGSAFRGSVRRDIGNFVGKPFREKGIAQKLILEMKTIFLH